MDAIATPASACPPVRNRVSQRRVTASKALLGAIAQPERGLSLAAQERRWRLPLILATAASLALATTSAVRVDYRRDVAAALKEKPGMTPHERQEAITTGRKVAVVGTIAGGAFGPAAAALAVALALWLGFKVAGGTPAFAGTFAVAAHALIPGAVRDLLTLPALLRHQGLSASSLEHLLPSSLAALREQPGPLTGLLSAIDVFTLWAVALLAIGMVPVAGVSRRRSTVTTLILFAAWVGIFRVALPQLALGAQGGRG
jgi:hypothetical protein